MASGSSAEDGAWFARRGYRRTQTHATMTLQTTSTQAIRTACAMVSPLTSAGPGGDGGGGGVRGGVAGK